jgi:hypothetical protein
MPVTDPFTSDRNFTPAVNGAVLTSGEVGVVPALQMLVEVPPAAAVINVKSLDVASAPLAFLLFTR